MSEFMFVGQISNRSFIINSLGLDECISSTDLVYAAYRHWSMHFNQYVAGDYALALPIENIQPGSTVSLFFCLSAFSSHSLFYRVLDNKLTISPTQEKFNHQATVNPIAVAQMLDNDVILPPQTLLKGVSQLANGESQLWHVEKRPAQILTVRLGLQQKIDSAGSEVIQHLTDVNAPTPTAQPFDFNQLPRLSRLLNQPVNVSWQINFHQLMAQNPLDHIISDDGIDDWLATQSTQNKVEITAKILRPLLKRSQKQARKMVSALVEDFDKQMNDWTGHSKPDFDKWFALSYLLPQRWAQKRLMAEAAGKTITFSCTNSSFVQQLLCLDKPTNVNKETPDSAFSFSDASIKNIYDAMQRLMWHGYKPVTNQLFHIVPPLSAGLLKQHPNHPDKVNGFCFHTLTLDHLSRQHCWSIDEK
jgi:hypothetical protein